MTTISMEKKYRTRDGREVQVYAVNGVLPYPVHGAIEYTDGWVQQSWTSDGYYSRNLSAAEDLIEVKPEITRWLLCHENYGYKTREEAVRFFQRNPPYYKGCALKCVTFTEGEGLEDLPSPDVQKTN